MIAICRDVHSPARRIGKKLSGNNVDLDLSLFRRFAIRERIAMEFRFEAANSTNTPHFNNPNSNISAANFLVVNSANLDQRQLRLGLRLSW